MSNQIQTNVINAFAKPVEIPDEISRRELASTIAGFFEEFETLAKNLKAFGLTLRDEDKPEMAKHVAHLESLMSVLNSEHFTETNSLSKVYVSKIERLGITNQVIKARESGHTLKEIASTFDLSIHHVRKFIEVYNSSTLSEQAGMRRKSVFDITDRLEELSTLIRRQLANLNADPKNQVAYVKEMRECIQLAAEITDKIVMSQQLEAMTKAVGEIILSEIPIERRQKVLTRLAEIESFSWMQKKIKST